MEPFAGQAGQQLVVSYGVGRLNSAGRVDYLTPLA